MLARPARTPTLEDDGRETARGPGRRRRAAPLELLAAALLWCAASAVADPAAAAAATKVFTPVADAHVSASAPARNFGASRTLAVARRPVTRTYLRFRVTLPANAVVSAATLRLYRTASGRPGRFRAYAVPDARWRERGIAYRTAPRFGARLATSASDGSAGYTSVAIPAGAIRRGVVSLGLTTRTRYGQRFRSRETSRKPRLEVSWSTGAAAPPRPGPLSPPPGGATKVILAAGDIQPEGTTQNATAPLLFSTPYDALLPLGDNQYERGTLAAYNAFYSHGWGGPANKPRSYPVPGNHEGPSRLAAGYCAFFQGGVNGSAALDPCPGGRPYYSYDLGSWHMIALNSASGTIDDVQRAWLRADLAAHPSACTLAYWHHPRYTGGVRGNNQLNDVWEDLMAAGVDVALSAHTHDYQRFAPMNNHQQVDRQRGIRSFVVGTGGRSLNPSGAVHGQEVRNSDTFGVLQMTLRPGGYDWRFLPEPGRTFTDSGSESCR